VRLLFSIAPVVFIASIQDAFADQHWWTIARETYFTIPQGRQFREVVIYDKCVPADRLPPPQEAYESAVRIGWSAKLEDKGSEVDVNNNVHVSSRVQPPARMRGPGESSSDLILRG
jgi:hypothetical protein